MEEREEKTTKNVENKNESEEKKSSMRINVRTPLIEENII